MPTKPKTFRPAGQPSKQESRRAYDRKRDDDKPWRRWYKTSRWVKARAVFLRRNPLCVECLEKDRLTTATVVDHVKPHRGDYELFWQVENWQVLCAACHNSKTGRGE